MVRTSLHSGASQTPSWFASYFDCAISVLGLLDVAASVGRRVRVVVLEQVVLQAVHHDVAGDLSEDRAAAELQEALLVQGPVERLADVDVVERRVRQVHLQEPDGVRRIGVDPILEVGVGRVLLDLVRGRDRVQAEVHVAGVDLQRDVLGRPADRGLDAVRVRRSQVVGRRVPGRVADQDDRTPGRVARHRAAGPSRACEKSSASEPSNMYGPVATRNCPQSASCPVAAPSGAFGSSGSGGIGAEAGIARR